MTKNRFWEIESLLAEEEDSLNEKILKSRLESIVETANSRFEIDEEKEDDEILEEDENIFLKWIEEI